MQVQKNAEEDWRKQEGIMEMETYIFMYIHLFIKIFSSMCKYSATAYSYMYIYNLQLYGKFRGFGCTLKSIILQVFHPVHFV